MARCPYCDEKVILAQTSYGNSGRVGETPGDRNAIRTEVVGAVKKEVMYSCPHCDRVLGFAFFVGGLLTGRL